MNVISMTDPRAQDERIAGNKAAALARLAGGDYDIPPGIVVSARLSAGDLPLDFAKVADALTRLGIRPPWAVRSSSTAEDGASSAFPGIFRTVLGVQSFGDLAAAITKVDESLSSDTAKRYAASRGLPHEGFTMAVLIQAQVSPRAAGVAFSRDPVTGQDHVGVEANYGLGESVVDGSSSPDYFEVARDRSIIKRETGSKYVEVIMGRDGLERRAVSQALRMRTAIDDPDVMRIADLAWRLEADLGTPQDLEWALQGSTLFLLQSRPITTGVAP
jgi:pyruvate,water dikinase